MDLATIEPALCALAAALTGVTAACCVFENAPRPMSPDGRVVILSWVSRASVGQDGLRWDYAAADDPLDEMTPTVQGSREARLQFAVEVIADQRPGRSAAALAEHARTRLSRPSSRAALEAVGLALATVGPATQADYPGDQRMVSRSLFEVLLNGHASEADTGSRTSYVATVVTVAAIRGVDGVTLPDSIQPSQG